MGFPVDYELGEALVKYEEKKMKAIFEGCKNLVVKLICSKEGCVCGHFNGFFYSDSNLIISSGHLHEYNGANKYEALFFQGSTLEHRCELKLLHTGILVGQKKLNDSGSVNMYTPDVSVLESPYVPPHPPRPFGEQVQPGASVCVVGFKGVDEPQLSLSEGIVSYSGLSGMHITAHADNGYSGSPVLSAQGYIVGMIKGEIGQTIKQVEVVDVKTIHDFLISKGLPGFSG